MYAPCTVGVLSAWPPAVTWRVTHLGDEACRVVDVTLSFVMQHLRRLHSQHRNTNKRAEIHTANIKRDTAQTFTKNDSRRRTRTCVKGKSLQVEQIAVDTVRHPGVLDLQHHDARERYAHDVDDVSV